MRKLLALNKAVPGPGSYSGTCSSISSLPNHKPVVVKCFFKGADSCVLCGELQYGDYYRDARKKRPMSWCLQCFLISSQMMPLTYLKSLRKHRHCSFYHKHMDEENITYHLIPPGSVRTMFLREKAMWNKYCKIDKDLPQQLK